MNITQTTYTCDHLHKKTNIMFTQQHINHQGNAARYEPHHWQQYYHHVLWVKQSNRLRTSKNESSSPTQKKYTRTLKWWHQPPGNRKNWHKRWQPRTMKQWHNELLKRWHNEHWKDDIKISHDNCTTHPTPIKNARNWTPQTATNASHPAAPTTWFNAL